MQVPAVRSGLIPFLPRLLEQVWLFLIVPPIAGAMAG
jgi:hypothetical protein